MLFYLGGGGGGGMGTKTGMCDNSAKSGIKMLQIASWADELSWLVIMGNYYIGGY